MPCIQNCTINCASRFYAKVRLQALFTKILQIKFVIIILEFVWLASTFTVWFFCEMYRKMRISSCWYKPIIRNSLNPTKYLYFYAFNYIFWSGYGNIEMNWIIVVIGKYILDQALEEMINHKEKCSCLMGYMMGWLRDEHTNIYSTIILTRNIIYSGSNIYTRSYITP